MLVYILVMEKNVKYQNNVPAKLGVSSVTMIMINVCWLVGYFV